MGDFDKGYQSCLYGAPIDYNMSEEWQAGWNACNEDNEEAYDDCYED